MSERAGTSLDPGEKRRRRSKVALGLGVASVALVLARPSLLDLPAHYLVLRDPPATVDAVLVMAGDPGYERTATASRLVLDGRARLLILTGGEPGPGDSSASLAAWARRLGVRQEQIRTESASRGTRSSMDAVRGILQREGVKTLALVTSPYHQRRAYRSAVRSFGGSVRILNWPANPSYWSPEGWWRTTGSRRIVLSEYLKLAYYAVRGWA